jgi:hypothetical protein
MMYDPKGVEFEEDEPEVFHQTSEQGNPIQRGFCGRVLFITPMKSKKTSVGPSEREACWTPELYTRRRRS